MTKFLPNHNLKYFLFAKLKYFILILLFAIKKKKLINLSLTNLQFR